MKSLIALALVAVLSGCATQGQPVGYMIAPCQKFHDKGQFDLHAQCSQSVRNFESALITKVLYNR